MKIATWISAISLLFNFACTAQTEPTPNTETQFTCDGQKFDVKGYDFLAQDYPGDSRVTSYYVKKIGDKLSVKSYMFEDGKINRWMTYTFDKQFLADQKRADILSSFPDMNSVEDESEILNYTIKVSKDNSKHLLYSQYWCGWENTKMEDYEWGEIEFTFSNKKAVDQFLSFFGK